VKINLSVVLPDSRLYFLKFPNVSKIAYEIN